ncbi:MAG: hypothetical protein K6T59_08420, partial [Bryobacteraceae bacterium]|nr:hypothetical protein [Bryobacteraceae bacterium]
MAPFSYGPSRREFFQGVVLSPVAAWAAPPADAGNAPWYRRACRWGQTNISEKDPQHYDIEWWRQHWRRTRIHGVIINA